VGPVGRLAPAVTGAALPPADPASLSLRARLQVMSRPHSFERSNSGSATAASRPLSSSRGCPPPAGLPCPPGLPPYRPGSRRPEAPQRLVGGDGDGDRQDGDCGPDRGPQRHCWHGTALSRRTVAPYGFRMPARRRILGLLHGTCGRRSRGSFMEGGAARCDGEGSEKNQGGDCRHNRCCSQWLLISASSRGC
jgi:hypothetical protein